MINKVSLIPRLFCWSTKSENPIKKLSYDKIISGISDEFHAQLDNKKFTVRTSLVNQLFKSDLASVLNKSALSETALTEECFVQSEFVTKQTFADSRIGAIFYRTIPDAINFMHQIFDMSLKILGVFEIDKEAEDADDAKLKFQQYITILSYPSLVLVACTRFLSLPFSLLATGAIMAASVVGLSVYVKYLKPCPDTIKGFLNLTTDAKKKILAPVFGRDEEINAVLSRLKNKEGVLLLGRSGVGKSDIVNGVAARIAEGSIPCELKGKKVFSINTARLAEKTGKKLTDLEERLKGYEKDVIIFFDEIHSAWKGENQQLANCLKTFIDRFPYCIAATTPEEYKEFKMANDKAIARRLHNVDVKPMQKEQVEVALYNFLKREAPDVQLEEGIIQYTLKTLQKKHAAKPQPHFAKVIFNEAIKHILRDPESRLVRQSSDLQNRIEKMKTAYALGANSSTASSQIKTLRNKLKEIKAEIVTQDTKIGQLKRMRAIWNGVKEDMHKTALQIKEKEEKGASCQQLKKKWAITSGFILPALEKSMERLSESKELASIHTVIDRKLINKIIAKY